LPQQAVFGPLLYHLAAFIEAVYMDAAHLHALARGSNAEELPLMGAA
jgi:hypothetical protein